MMTIMIMIVIMIMIGPPGGQGKLHKKIEDLLDGHLKKMDVDEGGL